MRRSHVPLTIAIAISMLLCAGAARAGTETGFLERAVKVGGVTYRYAVRLPEGWSARKTYPVILFLHGSGERGADGRLQTTVGLPRIAREQPARWPFVLVAPQARRDRSWMEPEMQAQALAALEKSIDEFRGDRRRVYLTGLSMGGYGTWSLAARTSPRFAAYAPVCGGLSRPQAQPRTLEPYREAARKIGGAPLWVFHGAADDIIPVTESRRLVQALRETGRSVKYTEYAGVGHNSWDRAYGEPELPGWLLSYSLDRDFRVDR